MLENKKIKRLRRVELLEILVSLSEENDTLKAENSLLRAKLDSKEILLSEAGSIAEAAISVNGVFEAAQAAAEQYLKNLKVLYENAQAGTERVAPGTKQQCEEHEKADAD